MLCITLAVLQFKPTAIKPVVCVGTGRAAVCVERSSAARAWPTVGSQSLLSASNAGMYPLCICILAILVRSAICECKF